MSGFEGKFIPYNIEKDKTGASERTLAPNQNLNETTVNRKKLMNFNQKIKISTVIMIWRSSKISGLEEKLMPHNMKTGKNRRCVTSAGTKPKFEWK